MADHVQFLRVPPMMYNPNEDIPQTHPARTNRYALRIKNALQRLKVLAKCISFDECATAAALEFALSVKHYVQMFKTIMTGIQNPNDFVGAITDYINKAEDELIDMLKNIPDNEAEVPATSPYELALQVVAENCGRANQVKGPKDLIHKIIVQLELIYNDLGPTNAQSGAPRTIAFCVAGEEPDKLSISVATSKDIWVPDSFLQRWVLSTRAARFGQKGVQACKCVILEVDKVVNLSEKSRKLEVLELAANGYVARDLRPLKAQAFDGKTFEERDRCWRCRITFGFLWMSEEADPNTEQEERVRDFEGRWPGPHSLESGDPGLECGKCAEYLLWLKLSPELICTVALLEAASDTFLSDWRAGEAESSPQDFRSRWLDAQSRAIVQPF